MGAGAIHTDNLLRFPFAKAREVRSDHDFQLAKRALCRRHAEAEQAIDNVPLPLQKWTGQSRCLQFKCRGLLQCYKCLKIENRTVPGVFLSTATSFSKTLSKSHVPI